VPILGVNRIDCQVSISPNRRTATQPEKSKYPILNRGQQRFEFDEESDCQIETNQTQSSYGNSTRQVQVSKNLIERSNDFEFEKEPDCQIEINQSGPIVLLQFNPTSLSIHILIEGNRGEEEEEEEIAGTHLYSRRWCGG